MKRDISIIGVLIVVIFAGAVLFKSYAPKPSAGPTPVKPQEGEVTLKLGESAAVGNLMITALQVVEDSRCPQGVECIQAGTVRVKTEISSGLGRSEPVMELGKNITTEAESVTLVSVSPARMAGKPIADSDYVLTYKVEKRLANTGGCYVGGCSGQLCTDKPDAVSTCEWTEAYACYRTAVCERQASGQCGWTQTPELKACLSNAR